MIKKILFLFILFTAAIFAESIEISQEAGLKDISMILHNSFARDTIYYTGNQTLSVPLENWKGQMFMAPNGGQFNFIPSQSAGVQNTEAPLYESSCGSIYSERCCSESPDGYNNYVNTMQEIGFYYFPDSYIELPILFFDFTSVSPGAATGNTPGYKKQIPATILNAVLNLVTTSVTEQLFYILIAPFFWSSMPPPINDDNYMEWYINWKEGTLSGQADGSHSQNTNNLFSRSKIVGKFKTQSSSQIYSIPLNPSHIPAGQYAQFYIISEEYYDYVKNGGDPPTAYSYFYVAMGESSTFNYVDVTWQEGSSSRFSLDPTSISIPTGSNTGQTTLANLSREELNYSVSLSAITRTTKKKSTDHQNLETSWITASPSSGTLDIDGTTTITVTADRTGQESGDYVAYFIVEDQTEEQHEFTVNVTVPPAELEVSTSSISFGEENVTKELYVYNIGQGVLVWEAAIASAAKKTLSLETEWLSISPEKDTLEGGDSSKVTLTADRTGLNSGNYAKTVTIASNGGERAISVDMDVASTPILTVSPTTVNLSDDRTKGAIELSNTGNAHCQWNALIDLEAVSLSDSSGTIAAGESAIVDIYLDRSLQEPGDYSEIFNIESNGGSIKTIQVNYTILSESDITILSPTQETVWQAGTAQAVKWTAVNALGQKNLFYSLDNGETFFALTAKKKTLDDIILDDSLEWDIPETTYSDSCRIMIQLSSNPAIQDTSELFRIITDKSLTLSNPAENEIVFNDETYLIKWEHTGNIETINLLYQTEDEDQWELIGSSIPNTGEYEWDVPEIQSSQCRIMITETYDQAISHRSNTFTIENPPLINITTPRNGTVWYYGHNEEITWNSEGYRSSVDIYLIKNDSDTSLIVNEAPNTGVYAWNVSTYKEDNGKILMRNHLGPVRSFYSPPFLIDYPVYFKLSPHVVRVDDQSVLLNWLTSLPVICELYYKLHDDEEWTRHALENSGPDSLFETTISGLTANSQYDYHINISAPDGKAVKNSPVYQFHTLSSLFIQAYQLTEKPEITFFTDNTIGARFHTSTKLKGIVKITKKPSDDTEELEETTTAMDHEFEISGLENNTIYHIQCGVIHPETNEKAFHPAVIPVKTLKSPDTLPPDILRGPFLSISDSSVSVRFETTEAARAVFRILNENRELIAESKTDRFKQKHSYLFRFLTPGKKYYYNIELTDHSGNKKNWNGEQPLLAKMGIEASPLTSDGNSFTTNENSDTTPPSFIIKPNALAVYDSMAIIEWKTDEQTRCNIYVYQGDELVYQQDVPEFDYSHYGYITGLKPSSSYEVQIRLFDTEENENVNLEKTFFTTRKNNTPVPAQIVEPIQTFFSDHFTVFTWKTDLAGDSKSIISESDTMNNALYQYNHEITKDHLVVTSTLSEEINYYYQLATNDYYDQNIFLSETEKTSGNQGVPVDSLIFVQGPEILIVSDSFAKISWENNDLTTGVLEYSMGDSDISAINTNTLKKQQELTLRRLLPGQAYQCLLTVSNLAGLTKDTAFTLTTSTEEDGTPPEEVDSVQALINENGFFVISWKECSSPDFSHYNLYRFNSSLTDSLLLSSNYQNTRFIDDNIELMTEYVYGVFSVDIQGNISLRSLSNPVVKINEQNRNNTSQLSLKQNYPNPFNQNTTIEIFTPKDAKIKFIVYNLIGVELIEKDFSLPANSTEYVKLNTTHWPAGIYFYRIETEKGDRQIKKMILLK